MIISIMTEILSFDRRSSENAVIVVAFHTEASAISYAVSWAKIEPPGGMEVDR